MNDLIFIVGQIATGTDVSLDSLTGVVSSLGFPIFVAVWLLWKSHKDTQVIQSSINSLENAILELNTYIRTLNDKGGK